MNDSSQESGYLEDICPELFEPYERKVDEMSDYMGWTNKETWTVQIHASNDYNTYLYYKKYLDRYIDNGYDRDECVACMESVIELDHKNKIKKFNGVIQDMLSYSLMRVDWNQIAERMVDEVIKPDQKIKLVGFYVDGRSGEID